MGKKTKSSTRKTSITANAPTKSNPIDLIKNFIKGPSKFKSKLFQNALLIFAFFHVAMVHKRKVTHSSKKIKFDFKHSDEKLFGDIDRDFDINEIDLDKIKEQDEELKKLGKAIPDRRFASADDDFGVSIEKKQADDKPWLNADRSDLFLLDEIDMANRQLPKSPLKIVENEDWVCPFNHPDKNKIYDYENENIDPRVIAANPDQYLFSVSPFGPNDQVRGFRDNIILAYYLNKTLVLPHFIKHDFDPMVNPKKINHNIRQASEKVDLYELSKFINFVTMDQLSDKGICKGQFDVAYYARFEFGKVFYKRLNTYDDIYGFHITNGRSYNDFIDDPKLAKINVFPDMARDTYKYGNKIKGSKREKSDIYLAMSHKAVQSAYGDTKDYTTSDKQCSIYVCTSKNVVWGKQFLNPPRQAVLSDEELAGKKLAQEMMEATPRPKAVRLMANNFLAKNLENEGTAKFVVLHWRFTFKEIFDRTCMTGWKGAGDIDLSKDKCCEILHKETADVIATHIGERMATWLFTVNKKMKVDHLYIATPNHEDSARIIKSIKEHEHVKSQEIKVYTSDDLIEQMEEQFSECDSETFKEHKWDFVSQVEMELALRSYIFIETENSSWSMAIKLERAVKKITHHDMIAKYFLG